VTQPVRTAPWPGLSEAAPEVATRVGEEARLREEARQAAGVRAPQWA
jgi:hypothetical protein